MRPLYIDINGTTDKNGNASIPVAFGQMTGNWHNAKFAVGMSGPAEWAILVNGRPYTYGRGRRVTLGPELIQDGEKVTVSVIGGPPSSAVDGTCTGKSGDPESIMASFAPSPNTIALDTSAPTFPVLTKKNIPGSGTTTLTAVPILPGMHGLGFLVSTTSINGCQISSVDGEQSSTTYFSGDVPFYVNDYAPMLLPAATPPIDQTVQIAVQNNTLSSFNLWVLGLFDTETPPASGAPAHVTSQNAPPALWQAPNKPVQGFSISFAAAGVQHIIAAVAGQTIYLFDINGDLNQTAAVRGIWQDTAGNAIDYINASVVGGQRSRHWSGVPLPLSAGLDFNVTNTSAAPAYEGGVGYSQG